MIVPPKELSKLPKPPEGKKLNLGDLGVTMNHNYIQYHLVWAQLIDLQNWIKSQLELNTKETNNGN